ncbi:MAG: biotin--[acetyl-CoA-carboxylase] ligase [Lachnospiraceae bacterium]|nr:biotin--[acetyl-CoA-carboxylase] ligase [Lachnospiraceae bacterium]
MKSKILELLRSTNEYVSGQEICEKFGVSRTAVWKAVESLKKDGYVIEAVRNRGYKLEDTGVDIFNKRELCRALNGNGLISKAEFFEEIGSTNTEAKRLADEGEDEGLLLVADRQLSGRGRRGRDWISPSGKNVYYTLMLKPGILPNKAPMLTLVMALSVASAIEDLRKEAEGAKETSGVCKKQNDDLPKVSIKWPNDILIGGKKVCGILTEMSAENDYIHYVVIGVGINVKLQHFDKEIKDKATSIDEAFGSATNRCNLVGRIIAYFEKHYKAFLENEDLSLLKAEYESFLINKDKEVKILDPKGEYVARAIGINDIGELTVKKENGEIIQVYAGEVSVRGIYGYT